MKTRSYYLFVVFLVFSMCFTVFSCSDDSNEQKNTNDDNGNSIDNNINKKSIINDNFFNLSSNDQRSHWLNSKKLCYAGWDIHPYKKCSLKNDEIKNYKESKFSVCTIESERHDCKKCRDKSFGIENILPIENKPIIKEYPINIDIFAPQPDKSMLVFHKGRRADRKYPVTVKTLPYNSLPNAHEMCKSHLSQVESESRKKSPAGDTVNVYFLSGSFVMAPNNQPLQDHMLHGLRMQRLNPFLTEMYEIDFEITPLNRIVNAKLSCTYTLDRKRTIYKEEENCEVCGSSYDEIQFKPCIACGIEETITVKATSSLLSKEQVEQNEGKIVTCKTCDDISFDPLKKEDTQNQKNVIRKIMCLKNNLNQFKEQDPFRSYIELELNRLKNYSDIE